MKNTGCRQLILFVYLTSLACTGDKGTLQGQVTSVFGGRVRAEVQVTGLADKASSDEGGYFEIPYVPGSFELRVRAPGHVQWTQHFDLATGATVELAPVELVPVPPDVGVWRIDGDHYAPVPGETLRRPPSMWLGLSEVRRLGSVTSGEVTVVCKDKSLFRLGASTGSTVALDVARRDGRILQEVGGGVPPVTQIPLGEGVWRVTPTREGDFALVELNERGEPPTVWSLQVQVCPNEGVVHGE